MEWPTRDPADVMDHHELGYVYDQEEAQVWHNDQQQSVLGGAWTGWTYLSNQGDMAKNLVVVPNADGRLHAFGIGTVVGS
jgi:hypothetical protein